MAGKLRKIHVIIIGAVACIAVGVGFYFLLIKGVREEIAQLENRYAEAKKVYDTLPQVQSRLMDAQTRYRMVVATYNQFMRTKMPPITFQDRAQGMIALWKEQAEVLGPMIRNWPSKTGVRLVSNVQVPAAPTDPNAINTEIIRIPLGTFQVRGSFEDILKHIRSWRNFGRLVQIDPPSLTGPSPGMTAQYGVTVYIFPYGQAGPTVTMAGSGGGAPGGGG